MARTRAQQPVAAPADAPESAASTGWNSPPLAGETADAPALPVQREDASQEQVEPASSQDPELGRDELIRQAAYRRFEARDGAQGDPVQDWLEAEAEVDSMRLGR